MFEARRDVRNTLAALTVLVAGLEFRRDRMAEACADPQLLATDAVEELVAGGVPFRDAYEQVAGEVAAGSFLPPAAPRPRPAPGPGGVAQAIAEAQSRLGARPLP